MRLKSVLIGTAAALMAAAIPATANAESFFSFSISNGDYYGYEYPSYDYGYSRGYYSYPVYRYYSYPAHDYYSYPPRRYRHDHRHSARGPWDRYAGSRRGYDRYGRGDRGWRHDW